MRLTKLRVLYNHHSSEGKDADQRVTYSSDLKAVWSMESARPTGSIRPFSSSLAASSWNETKGEKKKEEFGVSDTQKAQEDLSLNLFYINRLIWNIQLSHQITSVR